MSFAYGQPRAEQFGSTFGSTSPQFKWETLKDFSALDERAKHHIQNVYGVLAMSMFAAAAGAYLSQILYMGHFLTVIGAAVTLSFVYSTPATPENLNKRLGLTLAHAALLGSSLGPVLDSVAYIDPNIITVAFLGTFAVFACFSAAAIVAPQRQYMYLGGILSSMLSLLCLFSFISIFINVQAIMLGQLYLGLAVFCGYVVYDTQVILEKARMGVTDPIGDSIKLFTDFFGIFVRILIILAQNSQKKRDRRDNERRR